MSTDDELNLDQYRQWIQLGRVDEVLSALEKLSLKKAVSTKSLLIELIPVLRRAGAYEEALKLLTHFDDRSPERDLEEALLLGELGATASALNKIRSISPSQIATSLHFDLAFHRGNFESVARDFEASAETFRKLSENPQLTELQVGIAKLNFLGARVYQLEPDPKLAQDLLALASEMKAKSFFALEQGCYYFAAYAHYWAGRDREAKLAISAAYSLGLSHRLRENLMLDLLALQIGNAQKSLDQLQIEVRQQAHAVYWDQTNFLENSDTSLASLLLHNSKNIYAEKALSQLRLSSPLYVRIAKAGPEILKPTQVHKLRESSEFPTLEIGGKTLSLPKILTPQSLDILETILRRQDFGIREAELWEKAWKTMFTASSSDAIRKAVERLRKTEELKGLVEIKSSKQRYFAAPVGSAKFTFQNS